MAQDNGPSMLKVVLFYPRIRLFLAESVTFNSELRNYLGYLYHIFTIDIMMNVFNHINELMYICANIAMAQHNIFEITNISGMFALYFHYYYINDLGCVCATIAVAFKLLIWEICTMFS